jgi:alanine racemase
VSKRINLDFFKNKTLLIDSRKLALVEETVFFAIQGKRHNGHDFIDELIQKGVRYFVVDEQKDWSSYPEHIIFFEVENTINTLQEISAHHREKFTIPIIGITGSNGKTIVKEWLSQMLADEYILVKSPKSYNSQVGVPLSVWNLNSQHELGIFEAGISQVGEMQNLQKIIAPTIGLFTTIGTAHSEGFVSQKEKIQEKLKLFSQSEILIYCTDYQEVTKEVFPNSKTFSWAFNQQADLQIKLKITNKQSQINFEYQNQNFKLISDFVEKADLENCLHCVTTLVYLGFDKQQIQDKLHRLKKPKMRLEIKDGINNCLLIDDTYNNDLAGLEAALDFANHSKQHTQKTVIISDMPQTGLEKEVLYVKILELCHKKGIQRIIGIGENSSSFTEEGFQNTAHFLKTLQEKKIHFSNEVILIKGARKAKFEQIVQQLEQKMHGTRLEINLDALVHNLNFYRSRLEKNTKLMVMVKAYAYGSRNVEIANLLQYHQVDYLAVAYTDEGVELRQNGIHIPIMVMNPEVGTFDKLLAYGLEAEIYSFKILQKFLQKIQHIHPKEASKKFGVHIKFDTGMHRLGFYAEDLNKLSSILEENKGKISVKSVFTHLAGSDDDKHNTYSQNQVKSFTKIAQQLEVNLGYKVIKHCLNSPGITRFPEHQKDMVRLGIGLYGVDTNALFQDELQPLSTLKTSISQIKKIKKGESVGYGRKSFAQKDTRIATLAIGYADGYDRRFSNGVGKVLINNQLAPIIGNVCMDMCMADIGEIEAQEGDEVIIFGASLTISQLAKSINTIPYEILTNVGQRVKRVFYSE